MKKKQKIIGYAFLLSIIITIIITTLIILNTKQTEFNSLPTPESFLMKDIIDSTANQKPYMPYFRIGFISIICFIASTLASYFIISRLEKRSSN